jgi:pimeloyl-ACP methyl ester carboxylesterase
MPKGKARVPIVVLVHGSEDFSARDFYALQRQLPTEGIGVFVYDKRGTGASSGRYSQSYLLLADDAIAAMHEAKRLAGDRAGRVGYQGGSQAGWVVPLAAEIEPVDFVIVGFGLAVSPLEEDREAIALDMTRQGYGADVMAKAMKVADATANIMRSDFREDYDQLAALRAQYASEPWLKHVHGDFSFYLLDNPEAVVREKGPALLAHVPADYDPMPVLRNLDTPQLWILGEDDTEAPSAETAPPARPDRAGQADHAGDVSACRPRHL